MTNGSIPARFQTNSQRYGNDKTIEQVFENEHHPREQELEDALAETGLLTEKEAYAFVYGRFGSLPLRYLDEMSSMLEKQGFESSDEFTTVKERAESKIADAIWVYELIDAFRFPDFPEQCAKCSNSLGGMWVESEEGSGPICRECADIDHDPLHQPW